jgi:ABC-type phosphonate transport system ATPase subunit
VNACGGLIGGFVCDPGSQFAGNVRIQYLHWLFIADPESNRVDIHVINTFSESQQFEIQYI